MSNAARVAYPRLAHVHMLRQGTGASAQGTDDRKFITQKN